MIGANSNDIESKSRARRAPARATAEPQCGDEPSPARIRGRAFLKEAAKIAAKINGETP